MNNNTNNNQGNQGMPFANGIAKIISDMTGIPMEQIQVQGDMSPIVGAMPFSMPQQPPQQRPTTKKVEFPTPVVPRKTPQSKKNGIAYDMYATNDGNIVINMELAGFEKTEIDVSLKNDTLSVVATRTVKDVEILHEEIVKNKQQEIVVGDGYEIESFTVSYKNGILSITYPKLINKSCGKIMIQ